MPTHINGPYPALSHNDQSPALSSHEPIGEITATPEAEEFDSAIDWCVIRKSAAPTRYCDRFDLKFQAPAVTSNAESSRISIADRNVAQGPCGSDGRVRTGREQRAWIAGF